MKSLHRWAWFIGCVLLVSGCAVLSSPYRDAYIRFGETGSKVRPHLKETTDPSLKALYDAFDANIAEAIKAKGN